MKEYTNVGHTFINDLAGSGDLSPVMAVLASRDFVATSWINFT